jgi:hypothetical protein
MLNSTAWKPRKRCREGVRAPLTEPRARVRVSLRRRGFAAGLEPTLDQRSDGYRFGRARAPFHLGPAGVDGEAAEKPARTADLSRPPRRRLP